MQVRMKENAIRMEIERHNSTAIVRLEGRLVLGYLRDVELRTSALIEEGFQNLIFNLRDVAHIGSSGLGLLLSIRNRLESSGGKLVLSDISRACRESLELTRMNEIFVVKANDEEALLAVSG